MDGELLSREAKQKDKYNERAGGELAGWAALKRYLSTLLTDLMTCLEPGVSDEIAYLTKNS